MQPPSGTCACCPGGYNAAIDATSAESMVFVGDGAILRGVGSGNAVRVGLGADVELRGLTVDSSQDITCGFMSPTRSRLGLRWTVVDVSQVYIGHCSMTIDQSTIHLGIMRSESDAALFVDRSRFLNTDAVDRGLTYQGQRSIVRITNSIFDRVINSVSTNDPMGGATQSEFYFAFNTFVLADGEGGCVNQNNYRRTVVYENNIVLSSDIFGTGQALLGSACTREHNITFPQNPPIGGTNLAVDPKLRDVMQHDFRLQNDSPAIDAAVPSTAFVPKTDLDGVTRPQGPKPDIGAYEYKP